MYVRVVRFTDVTAERMEQMLNRIRDTGAPPPGVRTTGLKVIFDEGQGTAVVLQEYANAQDMEDAAKVFDAMDASDTPGSRTSVDGGELRLELHA